MFVAPGRRGWLGGWVRDLQALSGAKQSQSVAHYLGSKNIG